MEPPPDPGSVEEERRGDVIVLRVKTHMACVWVCYGLILFPCAVYGMWKAINVVTELRAIKAPVGWRVILALILGLIGVTWPLVAALLLGFDDLERFLF